MTSTQLHIAVHNQSFRVNEEQWRWKVSVEQTTQIDTADEMRPNIVRVQMHLHPTFPISTVQLKQTAEQRFESDTFTGWGTFALHFDVYVENGKDERKICLEHELRFGDAGGHTTNHIVPVTSSSHSREALLEELKHKPFLHPNHEKFWHGRAHDSPSLVRPTNTWHSKEPPRDDHGHTPAWLTASEYEDSTTVMRQKVSKLAELLRVSQNTVVYSGAGISSAAGIGQAARGAGRSGHVYTTARPTLTHHVLTTLYQKGYIKGGWLQQNHDGLPQKAGFPQEKINEVHGSWYDPSNPVVVYSGQLKTDEYQWMLRQTREADLVLVLGTTLSGLNADQIAHNTANRSLTGRSLGTVIINLQQTLHDGKSTLRIFGQTDQVFTALAKEMNIALPMTSASTTTASMSLPSVSTTQRVLVPYDKDGNYSPSAQTWWDLRPGTAIKLTPDHNVAGAGQASHLPIRQGQGHVVRWNNSTQGIELLIDGVHMCLGQWWIDAAVRGGPKTLPVTNV